MLTPQQAMDQACMTAETYVRRGLDLYETLFDTARPDNREHCMQFIDTYVRAATQDYDTWAKAYLVPQVAPVIAGRIDDASSA